jgi:hypothetical protein
MNCKGSGRGVIGLSSHHLPRGTHKNHDKHHSGQLVARPRLEPSTSRIGFYSVTAKPTRSLSVEP